MPTHKRTLGCGVSALGRRAALTRETHKDFQLGTVALSRGCLVDVVGDGVVVDLEEERGVFRRNFLNSTDRLDVVLSADLNSERVSR